MTLATRCSACGTSFRVVQDQLKVSGGWVRCGRCNEVFNALEGLYEIYTQPGELPGSSPARGSGAPASQAAPASGTSLGTSPAAPGAWSSPSPGAAPAPVRSTALDTSVALAGQGARSGPPDAAKSPATDAPEATEPAGTREPQAFFEAPAESAGEAAPHESFDDVETRLEPRPGEDGGATPSFMRQEPARRARTALSAGQRWLWGSLAALAMAALALQLSLAHRDLLAAHEPALRPLLQRVCAPLGCRVEPLRRIGLLSVEGSNLRQRGGEGSYELLVNLRNRGHTSLMMPAFELTLTDTQGQALVRRVLRAGELGARTDTIAAGADTSLQASLEIADRRIAGYTVEIFYP
jgi:predicted Zn finger-like uncharacterized protein